MLIIGLSSFGYFLFQLNIKSSIGRLMEWQISWPMLLEHPIHGIGFNRFAVEYLDYQARFFENPAHKYLIYKAVDLKGAHSEYLQAFFEGGFLGGILFLTIWILAVLFLYKTIKTYKKKIIFYDGLFIILLTVLTHGLVDSVLHVLPISLIVCIILSTK